MVLLEIILLLVNMIGGLKIGDGYQNRPLCRNPKITIQNGDLYPTKTTDIIAFADSCGLGLNCFLTGADLSPVISGMSSPYTIGLVLKRGEDAATVMMFAYSKKEVYCLFKNTTWDTIVTKL